MTLKQLEDRRDDLDYTIQRRNEDISELEGKLMERISQLVKARKDWDRTNKDIAEKLAKRKAKK